MEFDAEDRPTWSELYADDIRAAREDADIAEYGMCHQCGHIAYQGDQCLDCWRDEQADYADLQRDRDDLYGGYGTSNY